MLPDPGSFSSVSSCTQHRGKGAFLSLSLILTLFKCGGGSTNGSGNTKNTNFNDLIARLQSAKDGDVVEISSGLYVIPDEITIDHNITLKGAGIGKTIFQGTGSGILQAYGHNSSVSLRITGISFTSKDQTCKAGIQIIGELADFRIDHCKFENVGRGVWPLGTFYGVIDHCVFHNTGLGVITDRDLDQTSWDSPEPLGIDHAFFVEDNQFIGDDPAIAMCPIDGMNGARYVFRDNDVSLVSGDYPLVRVHGNQSHSLTSYRGTFSAEIYDNVFYGKEQYYGMYIGGGRGVVFNNVISGGVTMPICLSDYSSFSYIDPNTGDYYGKNYPSLDQINNYFIWNNTLNGNPVSDGVPDLYVQDRGYERQNIQNNRDYFEYDPGYVPFTYPHPLVKD